MAQDQKYESNTLSMVCKHCTALGTHSSLLVDSVVFKHKNVLPEIQVFHRVKTLYLYLGNLGNFPFYKGQKFKNSSN